MTRTSSAPAAAARALRREVLQTALPETVTLLKRCRAAEIDERMIDDYVALNWLEWNGGRLRLTITGENIWRRQQSMHAS